MHSLRALLGTFRQIPCAFFIGNATILNDQETDDSTEKIQGRVTFQRVSMGSDGISSPSQSREESGHSRYLVSVHFRTPVKHD